jgi:HTH-type transcriptional regulator/antitoxin HigA
MEALMDRKVVEDVVSHFKALNFYIPLHPIHDAEGYAKAVAVMNGLLDSGAADESDTLAELVSTLGSLIGEYDNTHFPAEKISPEAMLRFFMEQHQLSQSDLREIGTQGVVSEILNGYRELNIRQIKALAKRFHVSPAAFIA